MLQLLTCDDVGGTESMVSAQVLGRHAERVYYEVAILAPPGSVASRLAQGGVVVHSLGVGGWAGKARQLTRILRHRQFDVVNAYGFKATMLARTVVHRPGLGSSLRPVLICGVRGLHTTEVEDMDSLKARVVTFLERLTRGAVDIWDANSEGAAAFVRKLGVPADRVRCIPNGLDLTLWPLDETPRRMPPRILCVSRFVARKRQADLVSALARLRDAGVAFEADLVGDGPTKEDVQRLARSLGLDRQVRFHGTLGHIPIRGLMQHASVFCLASTWEGMPGAVMEAMAAGLAVVGTEVNGTDVLIVEGVTGRLVPPRAPEQLAAALADCLKDPALTREMGRAGRRRIEQEFSLESMIERKETLYAEAAKLVR